MSTSAESITLQEAFGAPEAQECGVLHYRQRLSHSFPEFLRKKSPPHSSWKSNELALVGKSFQRGPNFSNKMSKSTSLQWCDSTANPLMGCCGCELWPTRSQITASISASLRIASYRVRRSIQLDRGRFTEFDEAEHSKQSLHPAEIKYVRELPLEAQRQLLLFLLEEGVRSSAISTANSQIIHQMVDQELSQTEMAKELGISRQAVNQRIRCVAAVLNEALERAEFPMQST